MIRSMAFTRAYECTAAAVALIVMTSFPIFQAGAADASCDATPAFHLLDFWVGTWDVASAYGHGKDTVRKIVSGCAVTEEWDGGPGDTGQSLFYFNVNTQKWTQVWVSNAATSLGGMKEKVYVGSPTPGSVRFQGPLPGTSHGQPILDRTTLTPMTLGRIHQVIEVSRDGGSTWRATFDAIYTPIKQ